MLLLKLIPLVAKLLVKAWISDNESVLELVEKGADAASGNAEELLRARRLKRQLEAIAERIAIDLASIFEAEIGQAPEQTIEILVTNLEIILGKTPVDAAMIADNDFDPTKIYQLIIGNSGQELSLLGEKLEPVVARALQETVKYVVEVASELPKFSEKVAAEILRRETFLIDAAERILAEIKRISSYVPNSDLPRDAAKFEADYRLSILRKLDELELFGVDLPPFAKKRRLSVAYVSLNVQKAEKPSRTRELKLEVQGSPINSPKPSNAPISMDTLLETSSRLLIKGLAGSGKTTLLQWIAVGSAGKRFTGSLTSWNDLVPFYLTLRSYKDSALPKLSEFLLTTTPVLSEQAPQGWVKDLLSSGRAVILVDGVDELQSSKRAKVKEWLEELLGLFPNSKYIITSRPSAIEEGWLDPIDFQTAELQPMDLNDISAFIDHWHAAFVLPQGQEAEAKKIEAEHAERLKLSVRSSRPIRGLATNPLLCAIICAMNRARFKKIPADRIDLYNACCDMLIERRDSEREVDMSEYPDLKLRQKVAILEDVAYWMLRNGESEAEIEQFTARVRTKLTMITPLAPTITLPAVIKLLVERCGLIRSPAVGKLDFAHRSFLEFLAAREILHQGDLGVLITNAHDDQWRDVIVLATGQASPPQREHIIKKLLQRGYAEPANRHRFHLLAVACLETATELQPELIGEINKCLQKIVPPKGMSDAKALAAAGELAVPYLRRKGSRRENAITTAAMIRTLGIIGSDASLEAIESHASDNRQTVTNELVRAWPEFDQAEYAARILSDRTALNLSRIKSLDGYDKLVRLERLFAYDCTALTSLAPLAACKRLSQLNLLIAPSLNDISPIFDLPQLDYLILGNATSLDQKSWSGAERSKSIQRIQLFSTPLTDITPIASIPTLRFLELGYCTELRSLSPLAGAKHLTQLRLFNVPIESLEFVRNLPKLKALFVHGCAQLHDVAAIQSLTNLDVCQVTGSPKIKEINFKK